jgi:signal transduction histidine kinase
VIHGNLAEVVGRPWTHAIFWVVVLAAGAVDIATFYQVLVVVLNAPEWLVWAAVVGFVAVVLTLAHNAGLQIRKVVDPRYQIASGTMAWTFGGTWLFLGLVAFGVRFVITQPLSSDVSTFSGDAASSTSFNAVDTTSQHVTALLFLALYIATGVITALAGGYAGPDPNAKLFGRAVDQRSSAVHRHAATKRRFGRVVHLAEELEDAVARSEAVWATAQEQCAAAAERLKREIRLRIAAVPPPPPPYRATPTYPPPPPRQSAPSHQSAPSYPDASSYPTVPLHLPALPAPPKPLQPDNEEPTP